jgi:hypothetical protein
MARDRCRASIVTDNLMASPISTASHNHRAQYTGDFEWYTPAEYVDAAREVMGCIDLDPASCEFANATVKAQHFFSIDDSGLMQDWFGNVWLNPPYAQPAIMRFMEKLVEETSKGNVRNAIALTHNSSDTRWFNLAAKSANALCFTSRRIKFVSPTKEKASPTQGQTFFYFGDDIPKFREVFSEFGLVVVQPSTDRTGITAAIAHARAEVIERALAHGQWHINRGIARDIDQPEIDEAASALMAALLDLEEAESDGDRDTASEAAHDALSKWKLALEYLSDGGRDNPFTDQLIELDQNDLLSLLRCIDSLDYLASADCYQTPEKIMLSIAAELFACPGFPEREDV